MVCVPGKIRTRLSRASYDRSRAGLIGAKNWAQRIVECDKCHQRMLAGSLRSHLETAHAVYMCNFVDEELINEAPGRRFVAWPRVDGRFVCPVPGCPGEATTKGHLRRHFWERHPRDDVNVAGLATSRVVGNATGL